MEFPDGIKVYNFTVEGNHDYFVMAQTYEYGQTCVLVHNARSCGEDLVKLGQIGEIAAKITKNTRKIRVNGRNRIPDEITSTMVSEVKNVAYQHLSTQIKDYLKFASESERQFRLITRPDTILSKALQKKVKTGEIIHEFF